MYSPFLHPRRGFTLIELLIVVAIIAILAAIAVPNFLEAQVRAKVSRAKSDLRSVATALEAYVVDANHYQPNDMEHRNILPRQLSTPIAYITSVALKDPFRQQDVDAQQGELVQYYTYLKFLTGDEFFQAITALPPSVPVPFEVMDAPGQHAGALRRYGRWMLLSPGPDRRYSGRDLPAFAAQAPTYGLQIPYDPTNGTVSFGNVMRTQRSADQK